MTTWLTICDTCKRDGWRPDSPTDGARLATLIESRDPGPVRVRRHSCLMGCTHGCNVAVQAAGKLCYTIGRFAPTDEAAVAILDWARLHAESDSGQVPYRLWPEAIKGHFVTRHPPLPDSG
jgi:predicted metal-binding protein